MNKKSLLMGQLSLMAHILAGGIETEEEIYGTPYPKQPPLPPLEKFKALEEKRKQRFIERHGLKEFNIDGKIVYARNLKNAIRKAKNH